MLFYATGTDEKGAHYIIYHNEIFEDRFTAVQQAERIAKVKGLTLDGVRVVGEGKVGGRTMTKFFKHRKQHNGINPNEYFNAL